MNGEGGLPFIHSTSFECGGKRSFIAAGQANQPLTPLPDLTKCGDALTLRLLPELVAGNELRKVAIAYLRFAKKAKPYWSFRDRMRLPVLPVAPASQDR